MPIYEYTCKSCRKNFEKLIRTMSGGEKIACPDCGSMKTARAMSVFAVRGDGSKSAESADPMCGRCGGMPGSCQMQ